MNEIDIRNKIAVERISKINEGIMKSFDNIMFQQNKMDNKAFIFIGFLSVLLGVINKEQILNTPINWILGITIFILALSQIPLTSKLSTSILNLVIKRDLEFKHNIFYYTDLCGMEIELFKEVLQKEYQVAYLTNFEIKLMEQILINANILKLKVFCHNLAYTVLFGGIFIVAIFAFIKHLFF